MPFNYYPRGAADIQIKSSPYSDGKSSYMELIDGVMIAQSFLQSDYFAGLISHFQWIGRIDVHMHVSTG